MISHASKGAAPNVLEGKVESAAAATTAAYQGLNIFWQATIRMVGLVFVAVVASSLIIRFLNWASDHTQEMANDVDRDAHSQDRGVALRMLGLACRAAHKPATLLLPVATVILVMGETSLWLQVVVDIYDDNLPAYAGQLTRLLILALGHLKSWAWDLSKAAAVLLGTWFSIAWKDLLIDSAIASPHTGESIDRVLRPLGTLLGWALGAAGILNVLHALGLNIQPLLAAGGVSGIAFGFGAQKLTSNVLSGAKLFLTQPFVVGDRVQLLASDGDLVVTGVVESVSPMQTIVRRDDGVPVMMPNSSAAEYLVANESRSRRMAPKPSLMFDVDP